MAFKRFTKKGAKKYVTEEKGLTPAQKEYLSQEIETGGTGTWKAIGIAKRMKAYKEAEEKINKAVAKGNITQTQADALKTGMKEREETIDVGGTPQQAIIPKNKYPVSNEVLEWRALEQVAKINKLVEKGKLKKSEAERMINQITADAKRIPITQREIGKSLKISEKIPQATQASQIQGPSWAQQRMAGAGAKKVTLDSIKHLPPNIQQQMIDAGLVDTAAPAAPAGTPGIRDAQQVMEDVEQAQISAKTPIQVVNELKMGQITPKDAAMILQAKGLDITKVMIAFQKVQDLKVAEQHGIITEKEVKKALKQLEANITTSNTIVTEIKKVPVNTTEEEIIRKRMGIQQSNGQLEKMENWYRNTGIERPKNTIKAWNYYIDSLKRAGVKNLP